MFDPNPPPYIPSIHLSDTALPLNPQFGYMDLGTEMQRRTAELAERRARRADLDSDLESDDDYHKDRDRRTRGDLPEAVMFRRKQDELEIAHIERRVAEATRTLEEAKRDLKEAKERIRNRRREERQQLNEGSRGNQIAPEGVRPSIDDEIARMRDLRAYLSPGRKKSRLPTPQPQQASSLNLPSRSRSPSPYRFVAKSESEISALPPRSVEARSRSRSGTPNPTAGEGSANQEQVYQSFSKLHDLAKEFQGLKLNFVYPTVIDFEKPGSQGDIITIHARSPPGDEEYVADESKGEGKLAYTRTNEGVHAYLFGMEKVLGKLDSVDSWNEEGIRSKRRGIIGEIEEETSKLEGYKQRVWRDYCDLL